MSRQASFGIVDPDRGRRLVDARERAGYQQLDVAGILDISRGTLRRWERGYWLSAGALAKLADLYGCEETDLAPDAITAPAPRAESSPPDSSATEPPAWPQFAREAWATVQLDLVRDGCPDDDVAFLKRVVLVDDPRLRNVDAGALRLTVAAGVAAARAWWATKRAGLGAN